MRSRAYAFRASVGSMCRNVTANCIEPSVATGEWWNVIIALRSPDDHDNVDGKFGAGREFYSMPRRAVAGFVAAALVGRAGSAQVDRAPGGAQAPAPSRL